MKVDVPRRGIVKDPRTSTRPRKTAILGGVGRAGPSWKSCRIRRHAQSPANDTEGGATEGQDKNRGGDAGTEEGGETVPDSKVNAPETVNVTDSVATEKKLWELQRLLNHRKGSLSKYHGLRSQPEDHAGYFGRGNEIPEETTKKVTHETVEGDTVCHHLRGYGGA